MHQFLFFFFLSAAPVLIKAQQRQTAIYVLNYYYEEQPEKTVFTVATARTVDGLGNICLLNFNPLKLTEQTYRSCFDATGVPTGFGDKKNFTQLEKDRVTLNFKGRDTSIYMQTNVLKNGLNFWFWKVMPSIGERMVVKGLSKNFITNTVDQVTVLHTYLGQTKTKVMGKMKRCHMVSSMALNGQADVYDERWYDHNGMLVKERHVVGKDGVRIGELSKVVKQ